MRSGNTDSCTVLVVCAVGIIELGADVRSGNTGSCTVLVVCAVRIVGLGPDMCGGNTGSTTCWLVCDVRIVEFGAGVRGGNTGSCRVLIGCADIFVVCIGDSFPSTVVITVKLSTVLSWSINIWIKSLPGNGLHQKLRLLLQTSLVLVLPLLC